MSRFVQVSGGLVVLALAVRVAAELLTPVLPLLVVLFGLSVVYRWLFGPARL